MSGKWDEARGGVCEERGSQGRRGLNLVGWPHMGNEDSGKKVEKQWPENAKESQKKVRSQKARSESQLHF